MMAHSLTFNFWHGTICDQGSSDDDVIYIAKVPLPKVINIFQKNGKTG